MISGFFEILFGGLLLFSNYRFYAAYGIILLLILVFPANYYLYTSDLAREAYGQISQEQALIRMCFQLPLILIAYWHSTPHYSNRGSYFFMVVFFITIIYFGNILW